MFPAVSTPAPIRRPFLHLAALVALLGLSAAGSAQQLLATWNGSYDSDRFGTTLADAGDVDGDGVHDIAVGAPLADLVVGNPLPIPFPDVGVVRIYSGATHELLRDWHGSLAGGDEFGYALAAAGDVNGDGHDDLLVGAPGGTGQYADTGRVELRSGLDGSVLMGFPGAQPGARFGHALAAGDLDGDGHTDVAIGSPYHDIDGNTAGPTQEGFLSLFRCTDGTGLGSYPGADFPGSGSAVCKLRQWGASVVYLGDDDLDGLGELAVSAPRAGVQYPGQNLVVDTGFVRHFQPVSDATSWFATGTPGDRFGAALATVGDPDGDGAKNLAVGIPGRDKIGAPGGTQPDVGEVAVYSGGALRFSVQGEPGAVIGDFVAGAGDLNANGLDDLLIGLPTADVGQLVPIVDAGKVHVHSGFTGELVRSYSGKAAGDRLGTAMLALDLDHAGEQELVLAAPRADVGGVDRGTVQLFAGVACNVEASWSLFGTATPGTLGVPAFYPLSEPVLGTDFTLLMHNSAGQDTFAFLFLGLSAQDVVVKGGHLAVNFLFLRPLALPEGGRTLKLALPDEPYLCGTYVFAQVLQFDAGAHKGVAFSKALQIVLGH